MKKLRNRYTAPGASAAASEGTASADPVPPMPRRPSFFWVAFSLLVITFFGALGVILSALSAYLEDLPQLATLEQYRPKRVSRIYSATGELLAELYDTQEGRRDLIALSDVAPVLRKAVLASEDARFYNHPGVDIIGVGRAIYTNLRSANLTGQGASTITMQIPRNLGLVKRRKSLQRKIEETLIALEIERMYSKDEILEIYMNQVFLGHNRYGVEQAAQFYFGKSARDVTLPEAALLVGLLKRPGKDDPYRWPENARMRRNATLRRMLELGWITPEEAESAMNSPIEVVPHEEKQTVGVEDAPYFVEYVKQWLRSPGRLVGGETGGSRDAPAVAPADALSWERIYSQGYTIRTTVDLHLQRAARVALQNQIVALEQLRRQRSAMWTNDGSRIEDGGVYNALIISVSGAQAMVELANVPGAPRRAEVLIDHRKTWLDDFGVLRPGFYLQVRAHKEDGEWHFVREPEPHLQGCLAAVEVSTGRILALVGGYDFHEQSSGGRWFNRATQARRQPGSAFKPIVVAAGLEQGYTLQSRLRDAPLQFNFGGRIWAPKNFHNEYRGWVTLREVLTYSLNCSTINLLMNLTSPSGRRASWTTNYRLVHSVAERLGITTLRDVGLSLALGTSEVIPLEILSAYAAFANHGMYVEPYGVESIVDQNGFVVYQHKPVRRQAVEPHVAAAMTDALNSVVEQGTGRRAKQELNVPLAGKTGTTDDCTDAWFIGYSNGLAVVVYVGYDVKRSMGSATYFQGARAALPAWIEFMKAAKASHPEWFGPFQQLQETVTVTICADSEALATALCPRKVQLNCTPGMQPTRLCPIHGRLRPRVSHEDTWLALERREFQLDFPQVLMVDLERGPLADMPRGRSSYTAPREGTIRR